MPASSSGARVRLGTTSPSMTPDSAIATAMLPAISSAASLVSSPAISIAPPTTSSTPIT